MSPYSPLSGAIGQDQSHELGSVHKLKHKLWYKYVSCTLCHNNVLLCIIVCSKKNCRINVGLNSGIQRPSGFFGTLLLVLLTEVSLYLMPEEEHAQLSV